MRRASLEDLLAAIPEDYWDRRPPGDEWTAAAHLRHVATVDDLLVEVLAAAKAGAEEVILGGSNAGGSDDARTDAMRSVEGLSIEQLIRRMRDSRAGAIARIGRLGGAGLESMVLFPGAVDAWGTPLRWPLRSYLASWVEHDGVHAEAIRAAVSTPPDLATVMLTRRQAGP